MKRRLGRFRSTASNNEFSRSRARSALSILLSLMLVFSVVPPSSATGNISKGDLAGNWAMTVIGQGGCGFETIHVTFTLNANGSATNAVVKAHSVGCGDTTNTNQAFTIQSLGSNGSGVAAMSCMTGCGIGFQIQVSPDRSTFNAVDITDPANFWEGVAVHQ